MGEFVARARVAKIDKKDRSANKRIEPRLTRGGQPAWSEHEGNRVEMNKTPLEIIKKELSKLLLGIVAAALVGLVFWFMAMPLLRQQFQKLGRDVSAPSSQFTNDNKVVK